MEVPEYWKTELDDIEAVMQAVKIGRVERLCYSAGGRPIYLAFYGKENDLKRTANLSSALGARDAKYFADRSGADYRPTVMLVGGIHGAELEGTAATLGLMERLETSKDFASVNWIIIPMANPDGRARVPFRSMVGRSFEDLRYYNQGIWKDGTLCGWPECKKVHPIKDAVGYLGGYYNDDGINLMHDNFFGEKAAETAAILETAEKYAPDFTILLHGGDNSTPHIIRPPYANADTLDKIDVFEGKLAAAAAAAGLCFQKTDKRYKAGRGAFNLTSALHHICGTLCVTYESNQGLDEENGLGYKEIYKHHIILFEEIYYKKGEKAQ